MVILLARLVKQAVYTKLQSKPTPWLGVCCGIAEDSPPLKLPVSSGQIMQAALPPLKPPLRSRLESECACTAAS